MDGGSKLLSRAARMSASLGVVTVAVTFGGRLEARWAAVDVRGSARRPADEGASAGVLGDGSGRRVS